MRFHRVINSDKVFGTHNGIKAALKGRKFPAQIIWGKDDRTLRVKKYAPHLLKALDIEGYEVVSGKHFLQEDSSQAIASLIAKLMRPSMPTGMQFPVILCARRRVLGG